MDIIDQIKSKYKLYKRVTNNRFFFFLLKGIAIIYYNYLKDSLLLLQIFFRKHHIMKSYNYESLKKCKNRHKGQRCFIVATGPSLRYADLDLIKNEYSFGVNSIILAFEHTEWRPTYYAIQDAYVYEYLKDKVWKYELDHVFVSRDINTRLLKAKELFKFPLYYSRHRIVQSYRSTNFSYNAYNVVYDGYTVTYSMLQIAAYMGFSEIYLLGCDCNYNKEDRKQHFAETGYQAAYDRIEENMIYAFSIAKKATEHSNIKIYNATRGGMLEVFERVSLEEILKSSYRNESCNP
jgi:hypothetical protein